MKTNVPDIRRTNPKSYQGRNGSQLMIKEKAQIRRVLVDSIVLLYAAEAYFVTETLLVPEHAIETIYEIVKTIRIGF